jgi:hypothetical protein
MITYTVKRAAFGAAVAALFVLVLLAGAALLIWDGLTARGTSYREPA